jgi:hypothetical protein
MKVSAACTSATRLFRCAFLSARTEHCQPTLMRLAHLISIRLVADIRLAGRLCCVVRYDGRWQLLEGNIAALVDQLRPFAGTKFDIGFGGKEMREQDDLVLELEAALGKAGWEQLNWHWAMDYDRFA